MSFLRYAIGANYTRFLNNLKEVAQRENKNLLWLIFDFLRCFLQYGCGLSDYLNYKLWNKSAQERKDYVTIKDADNFYEKVSPTAHKNFFAVKTNFLVNFAPYIRRGFFVPEQGNLAQLEQFLQGKEGVMVKPVDGLGGHGVHKQKVAEIDDLTAYHKKLLDNRLFLEELIVQHPEMNELCPTSVNTIRVMTANVGGEAVMLYAGLRVGAGGDVDNFHAGGMGVQVNMDTGVLEGGAINKDCEEYECHPVTGVKFDGRQLPMWGEVRRMCLEASYVNTNIHVVGWDVAITPEGPTFVEGNRRPGYDLPQMTSKRGRKDILRKVYSMLDQEEKQAKEKKPAVH